jgi:hypothetical protein
MRKIREQRGDLRFPNKSPVRVIVDKRVAYKGIVKDASQKGAFIATNGPYRVGQTIDLDQRFAGPRYEKITCNIVRVVPNGVGIQCRRPLRTGRKLSPPVYY